MFETQLVAWTVGRTDPTEDRDRAHRIALAGARTADERRSAARTTVPVAARGPVVATVGGGTASVACCAA